MRHILLAGVAVTLALAARSAAGDKGTEVTIDGFKATTPPKWMSKESKMPFRQYTFILPKAEGDDKDAELVVSFTGKGSGGDVKANITRWQGMFIPPKGKSIEDVTKVEDIKVGDVKVTVVDIEGTFKDKFPPFDPMGKVTPRPDYRRINVIFASEGGPYFIYLLGPAKTVAAHKDSFDKWLKSFK